MKQRASLLAIMSILLGARATALSFPDRSVSPSQQFIIYGADAPLRGAVSELAERTKANLLALRRQPDRWMTPVVINLQSPEPDRPETPPAGLRFSRPWFGLNC